MNRLNRAANALAAFCAIALAATPGHADWSMFHGDPRHSGAANDASMARLAWSFTTSDTVEFTSPAVGPDGTMYVANLAGRVYALGNIGNLRWMLSVGGGIRYSTPAVAPDGTVYVGANDSTLYAIKPTGTVRWKYRAGEAIKSSPNIGPDGTIYFGADDGKLYALDPVDTLKWAFQTGASIRSSPAIGPDGTIFFGSTDFYFYALNPDGTLRWRAATGNTIKFCSPAVSTSGIVYFGSYDDFIYAFTSAGGLQWAHYAAHVVRSSPAIGADGTVFVGVDSDLVALSPVDGSQLWRRQTGGLIYSSPAFTALDTTVIVGSDDGVLHAVHANPSAANYGHTAWTYAIGNPIRSSPAPNNAGDIIVSDITGKVWAFGPTILTSVPVVPPASPSLHAEPNPSMGEVWLRPGSGAAREERVEILDLRGRRVALLTRSGDAYHWGGRDEHQVKVAPGVYFYRLEGRATSGRLVMLR